MRLKVAVCDDSRTDQEYVSGLLRSFAEATGRDIEIYTFLSAEEFLFRYAEEKDFQILILDIEMGNMNGVELAGKLRKDNHDLQILFVTGFPDFMAEGYEVDAIHYLLKPVTQERFFRAMEKAAERLKQAQPVLLLQENGETMRIVVNSIYFVEVFSHSCVLHTTDGNVECRTAISRLESELGSQFIRVHRAFLVNIEYMKRIAKTEILLENGETVPLARRKYSEVNLAFINYFGGRLGIK